MSNLFVEKDSSSASDLLTVSSHNSSISIRGHVDLSTSNECSDSILINGSFPARTRLASRRANLRACDNIRSKFRLILEFSSLPETGRSEALSVIVCSWTEILLSFRCCLEGPVPILRFWPDVHYVCPRIEIEVL